MARKRKAGKFFDFLFRAFLCILRGICWIVKQIFLGVYKITKFLLSSIKRKTEKMKSSKLKPKAGPRYEGFSVVRSLKGSFNDFENSMLNKKSLIGIILGARGSGKSAIGIKLLENIKAKSNRKVYAMGFKPETLPEWITSVDDIKNIDEGSFVLIDEGGISFSARKAMSEANKLLTDLLLISRHKDLSILFISQNSSNIEINTIRQADYLILKPSSLLQKDFERKKIKEIYEDVEEEFKRLKDRKGLAYIYSDWYRGFVSNPLPSFWTERTSKAFSKKDL